jgi:MFS family permease
MRGTADRQILYATAFLRAVATGLMGVLLGLYLARQEFSAFAVGLVIGAGLTGAGVSALIVTFFGDRFGRRRALLILALLATVGGAALAFATHVAMAAAAAFLGMVNGAGRDRAAALVLEQAVLPQTTSHAQRTQVFAWYNVLQDIGHALGGLLAALPTLLRAAGVEEFAAYQATIGLYVALYAATGLLYLGLTPAIELARPHTLLERRISPESRKVVWRISTLFAVDALAGGFLGTALLSYFFLERFGAAEATIATLFFLARGANAISHLAAAWLARKIGLINTMVFTHIPANIFLMLLAAAPEFWMAVVLFLVRELLVEMDVPTRQSYVMAMVEPHERTYASGVTGLVRLGGWAIGPFIAGALMQGVSLATPLFVGAAMKIGYDLMLWRSFRELKPPEERTESSA